MRKNNVNLKPMMLPKKLSFKKIFLSFIFFSIILVISPTQARPALAQYCPNNGCPIFYCKGSLPGSCVNEGGVADCPFLGGWRECIGGQWVETSKREENLLDTLQINPYGESSLERFQGALVECGETGELSLECFTGGPEQMKEGAASGVFTNTLNSVATAIVGPVNPAYYAQGAPPGAVQTIGHLIGGMYNNPPASSTEYLADVGRSLGIIPKPVYAQGVGFIGLNPVLDLWKKFRNIAYLFFVVVFVLVGFAIMFRVKIDPQTVISIQNALPKIMIALILVTFSYAIAGFLIDLIYVFISLIFALLGDGISVAESGRNLFDIAGDFFGGVIGVRIASNLGVQLNAFVSEIFQGVAGTIFGFGIGALATVVFALAIAFALFKLFFSLLMSYVSIILGVIFAPLILLLEAVPGQSGLGNWLRMMISNIIVFPITAGILAIARFLSQDAAQYQGEIWVAPFLGTTTTTAYIPTLIAIGMLLLAGSIVDQVKKAIGAPGIAGLAAGAMQPVAAGLGVVTAGPRALWTQTGGAVVEEARRARGEAIRGRLPGPDWLTGGKREATRGGGGR